MGSSSPDCMFERGGPERARARGNACSRQRCLQRPPPTTNRTPAWRHSHGARSLSSFAAAAGTHAHSRSTTRQGHVRISLPAAAPPPPPSAPSSRAGASAATRARRSTDTLAQQEERASLAVGEKPQHGGLRRSLRRVRQKGARTRVFIRHCHPGLSPGPRRPTSLSGALRPRNAGFPIRVNDSTGKIAAPWRSCWIARSQKM